MKYTLRRKPVGRVVVWEILEDGKLILWASTGDIGQKVVDWLNSEELEFPVEKAEVTG